MHFSNAARASLEPGYTVEKPSDLDSAAGMEIVGTGQRRTVAWLSQHAASVGVDFSTVWARMRTAVVHAVLAAEGPLAEGWRKLESGGMASSAQRFILPKILGVSQLAHAHCWCFPCAISDVGCCLFLVSLRRLIFRWILIGIHICSS